MPRDNLDLTRFDPHSVNAEAQLLDLERADCEESLYDFMRAAWPYIDPAKWVDGWHIGAICEHLQAVADGHIRRLIINVPPRHAKSLIMSVAFPAWVWAQPTIGPISGPGVQFLYASYNDRLSLRDSVKCRRLIESPWFQARWGERFKLVSDQNTKSRFTNDKGGERLITSVDAGVTGEGGNCFVAGTRVKTPSGDVAIERLRAGDEVLSFDLQRWKVVKSRVVASVARKASDLCSIREVSGNSFACTHDHPIYSPGRGFIRACDLGPGDRLLVSAETQEWTDSDAVAPALRQLWNETQETAIRSTQSTETGKQGLLLRYQVPRRASLMEKLSPVREVWRIRFAARAILRRLQAGARKLVTQATESVQVVRERVSEKLSMPAILLSGMCEPGSFIANEGRQKFKFQGDGGLLKSFSQDAEDSLAERPTRMRKLRRARENGSTLPPTLIASGTPHRREYKKQSSRESDHPLRKLPPYPSRYRTGHIAEVVRDGDAYDWVYDIQVEGTSCFFAEGILVHNCIVADDPNSAADVVSEAALENTRQWWTEAMPTRANDPATAAWIIIQQRLAEDDLTGHILEHEADGWTHLCLPGRYEPERSFHTSIGWSDPRTEPGELLWPERFSEEELKRLEKRMGPYVFAGQIQQRPEPRGGGIIKREWYKLWDRNSYPPMDYVLAWLDTAYTEDKMRDPSGMIVWGVFNGDVQATATMMLDHRGEPMRPSPVFSEFAPKIMMMYGWSEHLELHQLVQKAAEVCKKMKVDTLCIENKASGISVAQELRRLYSRERFGVELCDPKSQDKTARLYSIQHLFAEGIIYAPDRPWAEDIIKQVGTFPNAAHDEYADCTSGALRKLRDMGLLIRQSEREADLEESKQYRGRDVPLYSV